MNRRNMLTGLAAIGAGSIANPMSVFAAPPAKSFYAELLASIHDQQMTRLGEPGLSPEQQVVLLRSQFPQAIEQNFAAFGATRLASFLDRADARLLTALGQAYMTAIAEQGRVDRLSQILVLTLDTARLARMAHYLGVAPLHAALARLKPTAEQEFLHAAGTAPSLPALGYLTLGHPSFPNNASLDGSTVIQSASFLEYTIHEIYLSYRTAPIGALGVRAALYETVSHVGKRFGGAFSVGYAVGSIIAPLVQHYAPSVWDSIGATVNWGMTQYQNVMAPAQMATVQLGMLNNFGISGAIYTDLTRSGGDYLVVEELPIYITGGGGVCWDCHQN